MPHLLIRTPDGAKTEFILSERALVIGREESCELHLPDGQVSRKHARINFKDGEYWIEDLGSANGVIINGTAIELPTLLKKNDVMDISGHHVTYKTNTEDTQLTFALVGQRPPVDNQTFILPIGTLQVGRSEDNSIVLDDNSMSRNHAVITVSLKEMTLKDLESSNGTYVNGIQIQHQSIVPGDVVRFGSVEFVISQMGNTGLGEMLRKYLKRLNSADRSIKWAVGVAALSGLLLIATISIALHQNLNSNLRAQPKSMSLQATYEAAISRYLVEARNSMQKEEWQLAVEAYQQVLSRDPINKEARQGLENAQDSLVHQIMIRAAKASLRKGNAEDVLRKIRDIPALAHYRLEADALHQAALQLIVDSSLDRAILACSERSWKACHNDAQGILRHAPTNQQALDLLREAENQMKQARIRYQPWAPPPRHPLNKNVLDRFQNDRYQVVKNISQAW